MMRAAKGAAIPFGVEMQWGRGVKACVVCPIPGIYQVVIDIHWLTP